MDILERGGLRGRIKSIGGSIGRALTSLAAGISWRARVLSQNMRGVRVASEARVRHIAGLNEPEKKLISDSQSYWNDASHQLVRQNAHWRGAGIFGDDSRWLAVGLEHLHLYEEFARAVDLKRPLKRIVEWGCGGGMNAIHFGRLASEFYGIDISSASLEECMRQMAAAGLPFMPILIDAADPEAAISRIPGPCDLLISTYVFELLPTPDYGIRVLRIAYELLAPGAMAMIQVKYSEGNLATTSRKWAYAKNLAWNTTYRIEEFWGAAEQCGFTPKMVTLLPTQPLVNDRNYAYFLLLKGATLRRTPSFQR